MEMSQDLSKSVPKTEAKNDRNMFPSRYLEKMKGALRPFKASLIFFGKISGPETEARNVQKWVPNRYLEK